MKKSSDHQVSNGREREEEIEETHHPKSKMKQIGDFFQEEGREGGREEKERRRENHFQKKKNGFEKKMS